MENILEANRMGLYKGLGFGVLGLQFYKSVSTFSLTGVS